MINIVTNIVAAVVILALIALAAFYIREGKDVSFGEVAGAVGGLLAAIGLVGAGRAKSKPASRLPMIAMPMLLATFLIAGGCSPAVTQTDIAGADIKTDNQGDQVAKMFIDDNGEPAIVTKMNGLGPTVWMMDSEGIWGATQGPGGLVAWNPKTRQMYIWSPKDAKIDRFEAKPDGTVIVEGLELNISDPLAQYVAAFNKAADVLAAMTKEEALKQIEQWRASGAVATAVLDALLQTVVPHLPSG